MVLIGPIYNSIINTCSKRIGDIGFEQLKKGFVFADNISLQPLMERSTCNGKTHYKRALITDKLRKDHFGALGWKQNLQVPLCMSSRISKTDRPPQIKATTFVSCCHFFPRTPLNMPLCLMNRRKVLFRESSPTH